MGNLESKLFFMEQTIEKIAKFMQPQSPLVSYMILCISYKTKLKIYGKIKVAHFSIIAEMINP